MFVVVVIVVVVVVVVIVVVVVVVVIVVVVVVIVVVVVVIVVIVVVVVVVVSIVAGSVQKIKRNKVLSFDTYLTKPYQCSAGHLNYNSVSVESFVHAQVSNQF